MKGNYIYVVRREGDPGDIEIKADKPLELYQWSNI